MSDHLSAGICEAIAKDFYDGSIELGHRQETGITYNLTNDKAVVRDQVVDEEGMEAGRQSEIGTVTVTELPVADFVGGVTFALAEIGEIPVLTATSRNVARVCFVLSRLLAPTQIGEGVAE